MNSKELVRRIVAADPSGELEVYFEVPNAGLVGIDKLHYGKLFTAKTDMVGGKIIVMIADKQFITEKTLG